MLRLLLLQLVSTILCATLSATVEASVRHQLNDKTVFNIATDWHFFPYQLIEPNSKKISEQKEAVTCKFNMIESMNYEADGFASFRKEIRLRRLHDVVAFRLPYCLQSCRLFADGKLIFDRGRISETPNSKVAGIAGYSVVEYRPEAKEINLVWQVSSYGTPYGGAFRKFELGTPKAFDRHYLVLQVSDSILIGTALAVGVYHLFLFGMRPSVTTNLLFACVCFANLMRFTTAGSSQLLFRFFSVPTEFAFRFEYCFFFLTFLTVISYFRSIFKDTTPKIIRYGTWVLPMTMIAVWLVPFNQTVSILRFVQFGTILFFLLAVVTILRTIKRKDLGLNIAVFGFAFYSVSGVIDIVFTFGSGQLNVTNLGLFVFVLCQSWTLSFQFDQVFSKLDENKSTILKLNEKLSNHVKNLDHLVYLKTLEMRTLLDHTPAGICVIEKTGVIGDTYSRQFAEIVDLSAIAGLTVTAILEKSNLAKNEISVIEQVLASCLGSDALNFEINKLNLPVELYLYGSGSRKKLALEWVAITTNSTVLKILLTITDLSHIEGYEKDLQARNKTLVTIGSMLELGQVHAGRMIAGVESLIDRIALLGKQEDHKSLIPEMKLSLHTFKGTARTYGFDQIAEIFHNMENALNAEEFNFETLTYQCQQLCGEIFNLKKIAQNDLQWNLSNAQAPLTVSHTVYEKLRDFLADQTDYAAKNLLTEIVAAAEFTSAHRLLTAILKQAPRIAKDMGYPEPIISVSAPEGLYFNLEQEICLRKVFTHLIRNAVDHGYRNLNKSEVMKINVGAKKAENKIVITLNDSGAGLDLESLAEKYPNLAADPNELAQKIFESDLSTKKQVSIYSGRGVGLAACKYYVSNIGGTIEARLAPDHRERFSIIIALPIEVSDYTRTVQSVS